MTTDNRARLRIRPPEVGGGASREQLEELWWALLKALTDAVSDANNPPKASMINVARAFLVDNHVSLATLASKDVNAFYNLGRVMAYLGSPDLLDLGSSGEEDENLDEDPNSSPTGETIH